MKALIVRYEKLFNTGGYEHVKIAVEMQIEATDTIQQVMAAAKAEVDALGKQEIAERKSVMIQASRQKNEQKQKTIRELAAQPITKIAGAGL